MAVHAAGDHVAHSAVLLAAAELKHATGSLSVAQHDVPAYSAVLLAAAELKHAGQHLPGLVGGHSAVLLAAAELKQSYAHVASDPLAYIPQCFWLRPN